MQRLLRLTIALSSFLMLVNVTYAQDIEALLDLDIDSISMLDIEFESANKTAQKLTDIPSSVYQLSNERIIRSGYQSIAQILSLVPGLYATKFYENDWVVSSKGFHDFRYNKLLVMIDGRRVDSPMHGGVIWKDLDYIIHDIERIEVLRGPGGTMWGANAANGVINIITKSAQNALGTYVSVTGGQYDYHTAELRHGAQLSDTTFAKGAYKYKHSPDELSDDAIIRKSHQVDLSLEKYLNNKTITLRAGAKQASEEYDSYNVNYFDDDQGWYYTTTDDYQIKSESYAYYAHLAYQHQKANGDTLNSALAAQHNSDDFSFSAGKHTTFDLDLNYALSLTNDTQLLSGLGARYLMLDFNSGMQDYSLHSNPNEFRVGVRQNINDINANLYVQTETWWNNHLKTVIGAKVEYFSQNETFELSPQIRALYQLNSAHSFWTGIARAVMTPSYLDTDTEYTYHEEWDGILEPQIELANPDLRNESVVTTEVGYRYNALYEFEFDVTAFHSQYKHLRGINYRGYGFENGYQEDDFHYYSYLYGADDGYSAETYGIEFASHYQLSEGLVGYLSYSYLTIESQWEADSDEYSDGGYTESLDIEAQHNASLQVLWTISSQWQWDFIVKYLKQDLPEVAEYYSFDPSITLDTRLAWQYNKEMPLVEVSAQTIAQDDIVDSWLYYENEQRIYARVSYSF